MLKIILIPFLFFALVSQADDQNFIDAGEYYNVSSMLLKAIAQTESKENPKAINCANKNRTCDYGIMQINSVHLPLLKKYGISKEDLLDEKKNIYVGAWVLKMCIDRHGVNENAINCYNGRVKNNDYSKKVLEKYAIIASSQRN